MNARQVFVFWCYFSNNLTLSVQMHTKTTNLRKYAKLKNPFVNLCLKKKCSNIKCKQHKSFLPVSHSGVLQSKSCLVEREYSIL